MKGNVIQLGPIEDNKNNNTNVTCCRPHVVLNSSTDLNAQLHKCGLCELNRSYLCNGASSVVHLCDTRNVDNKLLCAETMLILSLYILMFNL